jgi:biopolymer transport protein TolR
MAFKSGSSDSSDLSDIAEINMIPLIDVMLVLLIIFMVAAPLSIGGINVQLPSSKARGSSLEEDRIILSISKTGEYFIGQNNIAQASLSQSLKALYSSREDKRLFIRGDKNVKYDSVVYAMSSAKLAGISKLSMLTKQDDGK